MKNPLKNIWVRRFFKALGWLLTSLVICAIVAREYIDWTGRHRLDQVRVMLAQSGETLDFRKAVSDAIPDDQNFCAIPALAGIAIAPADGDKTSPLALKRQRLKPVSFRTRDDGQGGKLLQGPGTLNEKVDRLLKQTEKNIATRDFVFQPSLGLPIKEGKPADMQAWDTWLRWQNYLPSLSGSSTPQNNSTCAADILTILAPNDPLVTELAAGLDRTSAQWTPAWKTRPLSEPLATTAVAAYAEPTQPLDFMLSLRSIAAAHADNATKAHQSLQIVTRIAQAECMEPFYIGTIVACGTVNLVADDTWEICNAQCGSDADFAALQHALQQIDLSASTLLVLRGEMAEQVDTLEHFGRTRNFSMMVGPGPLWLFSKGDTDGVSFLALLISRGWFDGNAATGAQWRYQYGIQPFLSGGLKELLAKQKDLNALCDQQARHPFWHWDALIPAIAGPISIDVIKRAIYGQTLLNQAIAACALERYRIAHGTYPDNLSEANLPGEKPIPMDIMTGRPMGYHKSSDGKYILWCVSMNGRDHGGIRDNSFNHSLNNLVTAYDYNSDWVWSYQPD